MTKEFRYAILMAKDYLEPVMVDSKKYGMVDDNFFH